MFMERLKQIVTQIVSTPDSRLPELPLLHRSLIPLLSLTSSLYRVTLVLRRRLYLSGLLSKQRLPVPVISVGNLTWGGNGKTPMTEFIASIMVEAGISPLILSRGYACGDEAKMLKRHLLQTSARIGVGANRSETAASIIKRYGHMNSQSKLYFEKLSCPHKFGPGSKNEKLGVAILDDGMQAALEFVAGCGNHHVKWHDAMGEQLLASTWAFEGTIECTCSSRHCCDTSCRFALVNPSPCLVLYSPFQVVSDPQLKCIELTVQNVSTGLPIFFSRMSPSYFFEIKNHHFKLPLSRVQNMVVLCVSAVGFPDAFIQGIKKIGPLHVDRLDFSDHHFIQVNDIVMIRKRLKELEDIFEVKAYVVVTEKDYDRDPAILMELYEVLVLCSSFQIMPFKDRTEQNFRMELKKLLINRRGDESDDFASLKYK